MNAVEKKIRRAFDYQRFAGHPGLARQIREVEEKYLAGQKEIPDEMLNVSAAGDSFPQDAKPKEQDENHSY